MVDEQLIVSAERLRDGLKNLKASLHARYKQPGQQVTAKKLRAQATRLSETWLTEISTHRDVLSAIDSDVAANLIVRFQRLLVCSEAASQRSRYDTEIKAILKDYSINIVVPLKQRRNNGLIQSPSPRVIPSDLEPFQPTAFVGHSFLDTDSEVALGVIGVLQQLGIKVETGERPKADYISEKVKKLIEAQYLFVGVFTRRDKVARKKEYTTSPWVIDEKAYAVAKGKKMILLLESGVKIGGIQGDYEYIAFDRGRLDGLLLKVLKLFRLSLLGLS